MDSDLQHPHHSIHLLNDRSQQQSNHQKPMASGLTRYQSAPSSYLSSLLDRELCDELLKRPSSPETERIFARFLSNSESLSSQSFLQPKQDPAVAEAEQVQSSCTGLFQQQQHGYYQPPLPPPRPPPAFLDPNPSPGMERVPQLKVGIGSSLSGGGGGCGNINTSNLVRHSSSPAGFFASINIGMENGYPVMRSMGDYGAGRPPPTPSSSGRMSPIAEIGSKNMGENSAEHIGGFGVANRGSNVTSFPSGSWDDIAEDDKSFLGLNESENKDGEAGTPPRMLSHHLSLHKTSAEMAALEKILHFQDTVPCKTRAKRGFATHPRSIAERVRRTKISERMRKLQDLVPNMDKQTNTADMLDLAVDYIKDLQGQVKGLQENRAKCICSKDTHQ